MPRPTLELVVEKYGTNVLLAPIVEMHLTVELYGRVCKITVPVGGTEASIDFAVIDK